MWVVKALFGSALLVSVLGEPSLEKGADSQGDDSSAELYVTTSAKTAPHQGLEEESYPKEDTCSCEKQKCDKCNCKNGECNCKNGECNCKNGECNCKNGECNCNNGECNCKNGKCTCKNGECNCKNGDCNSYGN